MVQYFYRNEVEVFIQVTCYTKLIVFPKIIFNSLSKNNLSKNNLSKKFLVSYDVTSLFTNIPLQETIDIAINLIFNHNLNLNITRKHIINRPIQDFS